MPHIKGLLRRTPHKRHCAVYCNAPIRGRRRAVDKSNRRLTSMTDLVWQQAGVLLTSGAIGSLLVWGYQNWLKR
jgi:hypothetical protein